MQSPTFNPFRYKPCADSLRHETKEFKAAAPSGHADAFTWLEEPHSRRRVAIVSSPSEDGTYAMMPVSLYEQFDNLANAESYLAHWELDGILAQDLPTVHDVLVAANDDLLFECVREVLDSALYPSERPDIPGACDYIRRMTGIVREFGFDPCDSILVLPRSRYRVAGERIERDMQVTSLSFRDARAGNISNARDRRLKWWHHTLGLKAWFGGVSIRDEYRAIAWLLCTMQADGLVDYGVWMGGRPTKDYDHPSVRKLNEQADDDLRRRAKCSMERLRDPQDMSTISFECEREAYDAFANVCARHGLSVQNGFHIVLRRLVACFGSEFAGDASATDE